VTAVALRIRSQVPAFPIDVLSVEELAAAVAAHADRRP
jgi:hypothetical protein